MDQYDEKMAAGGFTQQAPDPRTGMNISPMIQSTRHLRSIGELLVASTNTTEQALQALEMQSRTIKALEHQVASLQETIQTMEVMLKESLPRGRGGRPKKEAVAATEVQSANGKKRPGRPRKKATQPKTQKSAGTGEVNTPGPEMITTAELKERANAARRAPDTIPSPPDAA